MLVDGILSPLPQQLLHGLSVDFRSISGPRKDRLKRDRARVRGCSIKAGERSMFTYLRRLRGYAGLESAVSSAQVSAVRFIKDNSYLLLVLP